MLVETDARVALFPKTVTHVLIKTYYVQASAGINPAEAFCIFFELFQLIYDNSTIIAPMQTIMINKTIPNNAPYRLCLMQWIM